MWLLWESSLRTGSLLGKKFILNYQLSLVIVFIPPGEMHEQLTYYQVLKWKIKKKLIWNIFKTRKSFIEGRTTYKYRRIPIATITRIAGQPKIKIFLSAVKPFLTLREVRKGSGTDSARLPPNLSPTRLKSSLRRRNARPTALVTKGLLSGYRWSNCSYFRSKSNNIDAAYRSLQLWLKIKEGFRALTYQNTSIWLSVSTVSSLLHECLEQKL